MTVLFSDQVVVSEQLSYEYSVVFKFTTPLGSLFLSFFSFFCSIPPSPPVPQSLTAVSLLFIYESVSVLLVSSVCSLDSTYE